MKRYRDIVKVLFRVWAYICPSPCVCVCVFTVNGSPGSKPLIPFITVGLWLLQDALNATTKLNILDLTKNPDVCALTQWLSGGGRPPRLMNAACQTHSRTHYTPSCHSASPGIPLIFLGIPPFSTPQHNFGSFLLFSFGLTSVDPCDLPLRAPSGLLTTIRPALPTLYDPFTVCYI